MRDIQPGSVIVLRSQTLFRVVHRLLCDHTLLRVTLVPRQKARAHSCSFIFRMHSSIKFTNKHNIGPCVQTGLIPHAHNEVPIPVFNLFFQSQLFLFCLFFFPSLCFFESQIFLHKTKKRLNAIASQKLVIPSLDAEIVCEIDSERAIATLTINRPRAFNALNTPVILALRDQYVGIFLYTKRKK